jgi:hypothetical protein
VASHEDASLFAQPQHGLDAGSRGGRAAVATLARQSRFAAGFRRKDRSWHP